MEHRLTRPLPATAGSFPGAEERLVEHRLDNGLTLLAIPRPGASLTSAHLYVAAGSRCDEDQRGRAHLTEHSLGAGATWSGQPVEEVLQRLGARLDAAIHREHLRFGVTTLSSEVDLALEALGRMVRAPRADPDLIQREQAIIAHEIMEHQDGIHTLWDELYTSLWEDHPFRHPAVGGETLFGLGEKDVRHHWEQYVRPERSVLAVVGDLHPDLLREGVAHHLGAWAPGAPSASAAGDRAPVLRAQPRWRRVSARLQRAYFVLGWPLPPAGGADDRVFGVLARLLGDGPTGVLSQKLRQEDTELYDVQTTVQQHRDHGLLTVFGSCRHERVEPVLQRIIGLVGAQAAHSPLTPEGLARVQAGYASALAQTYETVSDRANLLGRTGFLGSRRTMQDRVAAVSTLSFDEVVATSERLLAGVRPGAAVLG